MGPQNQQIHPSIQLRNREPEVYSKPYFAPQMIPMGNHKMGHHQTRDNTTSPRLSEITITKIQIQPIGIKVIQSINVFIIIIGMEMVVVPNTNVVRKGIVI